MSVHNLEVAKRLGECHHEVAIRKLVVFPPYDIAMAVDCHRKELSKPTNDILVVDGAKCTIKTIEHPINQN